MLRQQLDNDFGILSSTPGMLSFAKGNKSSKRSDVTSSKGGRDSVLLETAAGKIAGTTAGKIAGKSDGCSDVAAMGITFRTARAPAPVPPLGLVPKQGSAMGSDDVGREIAGARVVMGGREEVGRNAGGAADEGKGNTGWKAALEASGPKQTASMVRTEVV